MQEREEDKEGRRDEEEESVSVSVERTSSVGLPSC